MKKGIATLIMLIIVGITIPHHGFIEIKYLQMNG